jgi:hypothetical protein
MPSVGRTRRLLLAIDWKHAIAEVFLIVVGVLLALGANNWNAARQERQRELRLLQHLRASLITDLAALKAVGGEVRLRERRMEELQSLLGRNDTNTDSADVRFGAVMRFWDTPLDRSVYEVLKATGLEQISSDSLRLQIAALYDRVYVALEHSQADDRSAVLDVVRPYYLTRFRGIRFGEVATPVSYTTVTQDPQFRNLLDYRLASLRANAVASTDTAIAAVESLLKHLHTRLGARDST